MQSLLKNGIDLKKVAFYAKLEKYQIKINKEYIPLINGILNNNF
jgi:hypothetical protein